jgi:hypothetical protein
LATQVASTFPAAENLMGYMDKPAPGTNRYAGAHGGGVRGDRGPANEGRFGRMFPNLKASVFNQDDLTRLGWAMTSPPERVSDNEGDAGFNLPAATAETLPDGEENTGISAGYTYFGQFMDHDMTFDPASSLQARNDPNALIDFRTPALDLDCLYGRGPADQPYMYEPDGKTFRLGRELFQGFGHAAPARDLPRFAGNPPDDDRPARALIGDKRNDENVIVSQFQGVMLRLHNRVVRDNPILSFEEAQQIVRWHYQWAVVNDYLPTIVGRATMKKVWPEWTSQGGAGTLPSLTYYKARTGQGYIPIEFSAAAYRFGHSMVRPIYRLNANLGGGKDPRKATPDEVELQHIDGRFFIFAGVQERGLNGFDAFPQEWAIDWSLFFDIRGSAKGTGKRRVQPAYKIDSSIVNPLGFLPEFSKPPFVAGGDLFVGALQSVEASAASPSNLAVRNLWRGNSMGLPSGQLVAQAIGEVPLGGDELFVGKAQMNGEGTPDDVPLAKVASQQLLAEAPLWYYVLAEANAQWRRNIGGKTVDEANAVPVTLGPVGGRIVAETLLGLVVAGPNSYLSQQPSWMPTLPVAKETFTIADLIAYALEL